MAFQIFHDIMTCRKSSGRVARVTDGHGSTTGSLWGTCRGFMTRVTVASVVALHDTVATCHDVSFHVFEGCGSNPLLSYDTRNESKYIKRQQAFGYGLLTETTSSTPLSWAPASDVGTNTHAHRRQRRPIPWAPTATPAGSVHSKTWEFSTSKQPRHHQLLVPATSPRYRR